MSSTEASLSHAGNLLGALVLALSDRLFAAVSESADGSVTSAAALSSMADFLEAPRIGRLQEVIGLTPSGAVRMVDRLENLGLVRRSPGDDGRTRLVRLTPTGRRAARAVRRARAEVLESALAPLEPADRDQLDRLLSVVLAALKRGPGATRWTCRLCDLGVCGWEEGRCPFTARDIEAP